MLSTHLCFLSSSPVLKRLYMDIEVRLEKTSYISMPGFSEKAVKQLLQFLHRGFVVFDLNESQHEFLYLCTSLKINPPVIKDFNLGAEMSLRLLRSALNPKDMKKLML